MATWQNKQLVEIINSNPEAEICTVCNDSYEPLYFVREYNGFKGTYDVQFIWKLNNDYKVTDVTEYHLRMFSSLRLDQNYRDAVRILRDIMNGEKLIWVEHPYHEGHFCDMTESLYNEMLEESLK